MARLPDSTSEARVTPLARARLALQGDRRVAAPPLPAPGRDGDLLPAARRARAGGARGDGGTAALPVGQGLVRRRRLPEDRLARARHALAIEDCVERIARARGETSTSRASRSTIRASTAEIQAADTVGTFQIESRAQMQSLLRTRPQNMDDLTVQVALVRPGPIQGGAVHPYIDRRAKRLDGSLRFPTVRPSAAGGGARARRSASSSSRIRCWRRRWRWPGSRSARLRGCAAR